MQAQGSGDGRALVKTSTPGVFKRGGGYVVRVRDARGKQVQRSARTLAEARRLKAEMTTDATRGGVAADGRLLFRDYMPRWCDTYRGRTGRGIRPETLAEYRRDLERYAVPFFGRTRLGQIRPSDVREFANELEAKGLSDGSVRRVMAPLRALLATAREEGLIVTNPASDVRIRARSSEVPEGEDKARALSPEEVGRLIAATPDGWPRVMVRLVATTGIRSGELTALRWSDLDLEAGTLTVRAAMRNATRKAPKSRHGVRTIRIPAQVVSDLRAWRMASPHSQDDHPVFATANGTAQDANNLRARVLKPAAKRAGLEAIGFHTLRHTFASALIARGATIVQVQRALGHATAAFTLTVYAHLMPQDEHDPEMVAGLLGAREA